MWEHDGFSTNNNITSKCDNYGSRSDDYRFPSKSSKSDRLITYGPVGARFSVNFPVPPKTGPADLSYSPAGSTGIDYWTGTPKDPYGPSGNDVSPADAVSDSVDVEHYSSVAYANLVFNDLKAKATQYTPMPSVPGGASARGLERATNNQGQPGAGANEFIQLGATTFSLGSNNPNGLTAARAFTNSFVLVGGGTGTTRSGTVARSTATTTVAPTTTITTGLAKLGKVVIVTDSAGDDVAVEVATIIDPATPATEFDAAPAGDQLIGVRTVVINEATTPFTDDMNNDVTVIGSDSQTYTFAIDNIAGCTNFDNGDVDLTKGQGVLGCVAFNLPDGVSVAQVNFKPGADFNGAPAEWAG